MFGTATWKSPVREVAWFAPLAQLLRLAPRALLASEVVASMPTSAARRGSPWIVATSCTAGHQHREPLSQVTGLQLRCKYRLGRPSTPRARCCRRSEPLCTACPPLQSYSQKLCRSADQLTSWNSSTKMILGQFPRNQLQLRRREAVFRQQTNSLRRQWLRKEPRVCLPLWRMSARLSQLHWMSTRCSAATLMGSVSSSRENDHMDRLTRTQSFTRHTLQPVSGVCNSHSVVALTLLMLCLVPLRH
mmetsp:Transcript_12077/g.33244  ORF Transcript_12077/g.33244 Transcript_12077/m.33244 type:complete len:246 (-) Transcript_12077:1045-1782(-)